MKISQWLKNSTSMLSTAAIESSVLDAEIILAHTIDRPRTWLHAHGDDEIDLRHQQIADARIDIRLDHVPVAYIIGHKEFYGRRFVVTPEVLIPRPESEAIIELLNESLPNTRSLNLTRAKRLVDIGTGSGCLGITAKLEHPELAVSLVDVSSTALVVTEKNAHSYAADVQILKSDLLSEYPYTPDIVLANLPYVATSWERSEETNHEPALALFAADDGMSLIKRCFEQLGSRMQSGGIAIFEADPRQWNIIHAIAKEHGFSLETSMRFACKYVKY